MKRKGSLNETEEIDLQIYVDLRNVAPSAD